jgi:nucleolysin TIA-1/TIAR
MNMNGDDQSPRTLYVGNLSPHVTEDLLIALFGQIGECKSCKIIHEPGNDPYAFVEFVESHAAAAALSAMNKRNCLGKEMKVNWATTSGNQTKLDSSKHYHIFVGDLAPDIDQQLLKDAFAPYGEISDVKIMKDPHTLVHKGYGFISFVNKLDAEAAIGQMNGQWLGTRKIRTNWATRKVQPGGLEIMSSVGAAPSSQKYVHKLDYNEVWSRSSDNNSTVYCGGINNITEELIRSTFGVYGQIIGLHPFPDRGYAFIRFATKEAACSAICGVHGMEINGGTAKCSWGKENIDITSGSTQSSSAVSSMGGGASLYGNASANNPVAAALAAQNVNTLQANSQLGGAANNAWTTAATQNSNWAAAAAANYQWAAAAGYPQNTMNYWQGYPGYQNAMMQQTWGVMPTAASGTGGNAAQAQYPMGQYQQGTNGKS